MDIVKDDEYVQKLGTELPNKENLLAALNISVIRYIKSKTPKAINTFPVAVWTNCSNPEEIKAAATNVMANELTSLREE